MTAETTYLGMRMTEKTFHKISPDLEHLAFPISMLKVLPGNPRRGDVQAVAASYREFGQLKSIVGRREEDGTGVVLAGNTQFRAARDELNWTHIAVTWVDDDWDNKKAAAFALADNRTHDLGEYDDARLLEMISEIADDDILMDASGYDIDFFADLTEEAPETYSLDDHEEVTPSEVPDDIPDRVAPQPVIQYQLVFDTEEQQQTWYSFVRWLKKNQEGDSIGERLAKYITANLSEGEDETTQE